MTRKEFLQKGCVLGAGAAAAAAGGCALIYDSEMLIGKTADLPEGATLVKDFNWDQIFVTRRNGEIVIFSLVCSHKKCTVEWMPRERIFQCPCHEGQYDEHGQVIDGPPPAPLTKFKHEIRGEELWVLNESAGG